MATEGTEDQYLALFQELQAQTRSIQKHLETQGQLNENMSRMRNMGIPKGALMTKFEEYDPKKENFKFYKRRFENFLKIKNVDVAADPTTCVPLLLNSMSKIYDQLVSLVTPKTPEEMSYQDLTSIIQEYFSPDLNTVVAQHRFALTVQKSDESITDYLATLKRCALDCDFKVKCTSENCNHEFDVSEMFIQPQFIRGLKDDEIKDELLRAEAKDFKTILKKALTMEISKENTKELSIKKNAFSQKNATSDINAVEYRKPYKRQYNDNKGNGDNKKNGENRQNYNGKKYQNGGKPRSNNWLRATLSKLGISNCCIKCGLNNHKTQDCFAKNLHCKGCNRDGHVARVCIKTLKNSSISAIEEDRDAEEYQDWDEQNVFDEINTVDLRDDTEKFFAKIEIEGSPCTLEVDSGATRTLVPVSLFRKLCPRHKLQPTNKIFRACNQATFKPLGFTTVTVKYNETESREVLFVVPDEFPALLGRPWIRRLNIHLSDLDNVNTVDAPQETEEELNAFVKHITGKYAPTFQQKVGKIPKVQAKLELRPNAKPIALKARNMILALKKPVEEELTRLESEGIISKVETSDWASPLVVVPKPNNQVRLCVDYKTTVNTQIEMDHYPLPRISETLDSLVASRYFCKLDIYKAYLHIEVDNESAKIQTIVTHKGTFKMNRLSFGIKVAPAIFHRIFEQIFADLPGVTSYFDDILVHATSLKTCKEYLLKCLDRMQQNDIHVNIEKCSFFKTQVKYLGHVIGYNSKRPDPDKIRAITDMRAPKSVDQVRQFLGMATFYSSFVPNLAEITANMRKLLRKGIKFNWDKECENEFNALKEILASDKVLIHFRDDLPVIITSDAGPQGIAAVMSHSIQGLQRPVMYASRALSIAEERYSQLDREALGIVFAIKKFTYYVYGRHFILETDNKPINHIFHPNKSIPPVTSHRLMRYAIFLQNFDFEIKLKKSNEIPQADCLSRNPTRCKPSFLEKEIEEECTYLLEETFDQIGNVPLNYETISRETKEDKNLEEIKDILQNSAVRSLEAP